MLELKRLRNRGWADWLALGILVCVLGTQLTQLGLAYAASRLSIVKSEFTYGRALDSALIRSLAVKQAPIVFGDLMPDVRRRSPEVYIEKRVLHVNLVVRREVAVNNRIADFVGALNSGVRGQYSLAQAPDVALKSASTEPYPWFKPLDFVSVIIVAGSLILWGAFPEQCWRRALAR